MGEILFGLSVQKQISDLLHTIETNDVGKVIVDAIRKTERTLTFMPRNGGRSRFTENAILKR